MIELEQLDEEVTVKDLPAAHTTDPPPVVHRRRSDGDVIQPAATHQTRHQMYNGARSDYFLGDLAKCPSHMVIEDCPQAALEKVSQLRQYDFAFIKRTDGSWTYAILAHRHKPPNEDDECMMFVMTEAGSTKIIKKKLWGNFVRCVVAEDPEVDMEPVDTSVPRNISIDCSRDDCSMISSTSFW